MLLFCYKSSFARLNKIEYSINNAEIFLDAAC